MDPVILWNIWIKDLHLLKSERPNISFKEYEKEIIRYHYTAKVAHLMIDEEAARLFGLIDDIKEGHTKSDMSTPIKKMGRPRKFTQEQKRLKKNEYNRNYHKRKYHGNQEYKSARVAKSSFNYYKKQEKKKSELN